MLWSIDFLFFFLVNWDKISPSPTRTGVSSSHAPDTALERGLRYQVPFPLKKSYSSGLIHVLGILSQTEEETDK